MGVYYGNQKVLRNSPSRSHADWLPIDWLPIDWLTIDWREHEMD